MVKRKKGRRRRKAAFSILNAVEAFIYAEILMRGTTGSGVVGFFTGEGDIGIGPGETIGGITTYSQPVGVGEISLNDLMVNPGLAIATVSTNFKSNLLPMALRIEKAAFLLRLPFFLLTIGRAGRVGGV